MLLPVRTTVHVLAAVPVFELFRWVGHSAAKCHTSPQYMHSPCARRWLRSAVESLPHAADQSIGLAAMPVAVVGGCMWCTWSCGRRRLWVFKAQRRQSSSFKLRRSTYMSKLSSLGAGNIWRALSISWFSLHFSAWCREVLSVVRRMSMSSWKSA